MTREEAIQRLKQIKTDTESFANTYKSEENYKDAVALDMAIEALSVANLKGNFESAEYEDYEHATLVDIKEPLKVWVVRCKDCRHYGIGNCYMYGGQMNEDDFCSYGERKK